jgi:hypothetical protein
MVISKFDLTFFSPHRKGVGFLGDYESIIDDVRHNQELVLQYYKIDLLGLDIEYNDIEQIEIEL